MPNDPIMLLSFVNTQLRDNYNSIDELCGNYGVERDFVVDKLKSIGYFYDEKANRFK